MKLQGRNLSLDLSGDDVRLLQKELMIIGFPIPDNELREGVFGKGTLKAVRVFQDKHQLDPNGVVEERTARLINKEVDAQNGPVPPVEPPTPPQQPAPICQVYGVVTSPDRGRVAGITVTIVDRNVGADVDLTSATTDSRGRYTASVELARVLARKAAADLQAVVRDEGARAAAGPPVGSSTVAYDAGTPGADVRLDLELPAGAGILGDEVGALRSAIAAHYDGALGDLREDEQRSDVTYLANKSGWDARAVAMASLSESLAASPDGHRDGLAPDHFYALLRAGIPADPDALYRLDRTAVTGLWEQAAKAGIIPEQDPAATKVAAQAFTARAATHTLARPLLPGTDNLTDLLSVSLGDDGDGKAKFATALAANRADPSRIWDDLGASIGPDRVDRLRLDGKLALLTLNNASVMRNLHDAHAARPLRDAADLVANGYHDAVAWKPIVGELAPEIVPGADPDARAANYAELLAAQVRLAYPTAVLAKRIADGEVRVDADGGRNAAVARFLTEQAGQFEIGMQPVANYVASQGLDLAPDVVSAVTRVQRLYQLTSDDAAIHGLAEAGIGSAWEVVANGRAAFLETVAEKLSAPAAEAVYEKASQVHNAVLNVATNYLTTRTAPAIGSPVARIVDPDDQIQALKLAGPKPGSPTLETLFGSVDYCDCKHCRSVLSPAAYLVDLLLFADCPNPALANPQDVLLKRRPDLAHVPLSCENTNTVLPYIDVVNETLEYFLVNDLKLDGYQGHDTAPGTDSADLLASPQFVADTAYDLLAGDAFPPPLPFHRSLELLRGYFAALEVPLAVAMRELRRDDAIERADAASYGWRDILMERARISRAEHRLLTDSTIPLARLYGLPDALSEAAAIDTLSPARGLSRRLAVSYAELVSILRTRFLNPAVALVPRMERLGLSLPELVAVRDGTLAGAELDSRLPPGVSAGQVDQFVTDHLDAALGLILVTEELPQGVTHDPCSWEHQFLRRPDPAATKLTAIDFVRLARFVRLWRKLDWPIAAIDATIAALFPPENAATGADAAVDLTNLDTGWAKLLLRLGVVLEVMDRLKVRPKDLESLLTCWAPIGTTGEPSFYERLFPASAAGADAAFAPAGDGSVLTSGGTFAGHTSALRAATGLGDTDFAAVLAALPGAPDPALTLANVSALYRHAWLARKLRISVAELLALVAHTRFDPFAVPEPAGPPNAAPPGIISLLDLLGDLKGARLKPTQALYVLFDENLTGRFTPPPDRVAGLARTLRSGFAEVESAFAVVDDPAGDIARARMALVYGAEPAEFLFSLLGGTIITSVNYSHAAQELPVGVPAAGHGRLAYDDLRKQLSYSGVLDPATVTAVKAVAGVTPPLGAAVDSLATATADRVAAFFARFPELRPLYNAYVASNQPDDVRRRDVLAAFLPQLVRDRKRQQALATLAATVKVDPLVASAIADNPLVLQANQDAAAAGDPAARPALDDLAGIDSQGLTSAWTWGAVPAEPADATPAPIGAIDYGPTATPLPQGPVPGAVSVVLTGRLEAPETAAFMLAVDTDAAAVTLTLDGVALALDQDGARWRTHDPLSLQAGQLVAIEVTASAVATQLSLRWARTGVGWEVIPARRLYPQAAMTALQTTYLRVLKVASLAVASKLTGAELAFAAGAAGLRLAGHGWCNALPVAGPSSDAATEDGVLAGADQLFTFARLKARYAPDDESLLAVLTDPERALPDGTKPLETLLGWPAAPLDALLGRFGNTRADLANVSVVSRVEAAMDVVQALGTSATAAIAATINDPTSAVVSAFQAALRARFEQPDWLALLQPIHDQVRTRSRDALVAATLRRMSTSADPEQQAVDTADKMFEYFLMDVAMEPCMQTSRIRHALSSAQLFIDRCLMGLEPKVSPSSIDSAQWEWMKRYRVWEANRKVFLWPENWLEPELRDDQSPFFKEVMSELLQGDVTEDRAAAALLSYLTKLEEVARLEPVGMYIQEQDPGTADDIVHVIARTAGANRKYFYRRREYGYWTAWESVKLDIEDAPIMPVVWRGRLFLFWTKILRETPASAASAVTTTTKQGGLGGLGLADLKSDVAADAKGTAKVTVRAILCFSEYVNGKWQPTRTSEPDSPTTLGSFPAAGSGGFNRSKLSLSVDHETGELRVYLSGQGNASFRLFNTHSAPVRGEDVPFELEVLSLFFDPSRSFDMTDGQLTITYSPETFIGFINNKTTDLERDVMYGRLSMTVVRPRQSESDPWLSPFLLSDARNSFYVQTTSKQVTIVEFDGYGLGGSYTAPKPKIPDTVWQKPPKLGKPDLIGPISTPGFGVTDPAPILHVISEDAFIDRALATTAVVKLGNTFIGPAGALPQAGFQR